MNKLFRKYDDFYVNETKKQKINWPKYKNYCLINFLYIL